jgi:hypothetical protein
MDCSAFRDTAYDATWQSFRAAPIGQIGNAPPFMKLRKSLSFLLVTQDTTTLTHLTQIRSADLPDSRTIDCLGNNSTTGVLITDHLELSDIVFNVALRRRRLLCDCAYKFPVEPNLLVETGFGCCLGCIFVIISVHWVNITSQSRQTYYHLGCVTVIISGLFLTQSASRDWLRSLLWLSLCYRRWILALKHPHATFSAIWDRLRLAVGYVIIKVDEVLSLATYSSKLSAKPDLGYCLGSISVRMLSFSTKPAIRDGLRLPFRLCLCYSQCCPFPLNQPIEMTSVTV